MALIRHLPRDGAVQRELHGESAEWSITDHLLAAAVDHLAVANWMFQAVNTGEDDEQPEYPSPVPRPDAADEDDEEPDENSAEARSSEGVSPAALARFFG
ncbi:hypothetical protein [Streptomyces sp. NPDC047981]|uniref:hypothetical protein n=1 Tax=Streptomyces sp. NPDC047981 TaxID=3154610 RepID=UPI00342D0862